MAPTEGKRAEEVLRPTPPPSTSVAFLSGITLYSWPIYFRRFYLHVLQMFWGKA